jgi:3-oxoacyl-[acyl-carrier protein] reductase
VTRCRICLSISWAGTVVVTGAAAGIGLQLARAFHAAGANVAAVDRDADALKSAWGNADRVRTFAGDVADEALVAEAVAGLDDWGGVDVLVNNAGITRDTVVWKMTTEQWRAVLDVHLTGTFLFTRAVIPGMRQRGHGRIINVTSYSGLHGNVGRPTTRPPRPASSGSPRRWPRRPLASASP